MIRPYLIRLGALAAMLAGVTFIFNELFVWTVFHGEWVMAVWVVGPLLMVVGMLGLHALQKDDYGLVGRAGFWIVVVAALAQVTPLLLGTVSRLGVAAGLIVYGVATLQAEVLPRWCGWGLIIIPSIALFLALQYIEFVGLYGLLWLPLGYVLWSRRGTAAERPARVR